MVIVDTTVWVDYLNGHTTPEVEWFDRESERQRLGLLDLTVCEVLQGVSTDAVAARVLRTLRRFEIFDSGGVALAEAAARNFRRLRARGRTVRKTTDCLIATCALRELRNGIELLIETDQTVKDLVGDRMGVAGSGHRRIQRTWIAVQRHDERHRGGAAARGRGRAGGEGDRGDRGTKHDNSVKAHAG